MRRRSLLLPLALLLSVAWPSGLRAAGFFGGGGTTVTADQGSAGSSDWRIDLRAIGGTTISSSLWDAVNNAIRVNIVAGAGAGGGTSSNFGAAFPASGTATGFSDGTNMRPGYAVDCDSGAGTTYCQAVNLIKRTASGPVEVGTSADPLRVDPTGATTQPVTPTPVTASGSMGALNAEVSLTLNGNAAFGLQLTGTWVGTVTFQGTIDGSTWVSVGAVPAGQALTATTATANGIWQGSGAGFTAVKAIFTAYTSGTATATLKAVPGEGRGSKAVASTVVFGSTAASADNGVSGAGVQRVTIASDSTGQIKLTDGTDTAQVTAAGAVQVDGSAVTQPVSAASLPLPAGAATAANQDGIIRDGTGDTTQANVSGGRLHVDGSGVTQPVSGPLTDTQLRATPVPVSGTVTANAGTGTSTVQGAKSHNAAAPGATNLGTLPCVATASAPSFTEGNQVGLSCDLSGTLRTSAGAGAGGGTSSNFGAAFPASGTATGFSDGTNMRPGYAVDCDSGAGTTYCQAVNLIKRTASGPVEAGTASDPLRVDPTGTTTQPVSLATNQPVGNVAHDAPDSGNPLKIGCKALAHGANPTAVSADDRSDRYCTRQGITWTLPGHMNMQHETVFVADADGAQTGTLISSDISAGTIIVVTATEAKCSAANTVNVNLKIGFSSSTTLPSNSTTGTSGIVAHHPNIAPGGGFVTTGVYRIGGDGLDLRYDMADPVGGSCTITVDYFTTPS